MTSVPPSTRDEAALVAGRVRAAEAERDRLTVLWLDDLRWHKHMFRQSRFQWTGEHAIDIVTRGTGGQLEFTELRHLRRLQAEQDEIAAYGTQCTLAMGAPLAAAAAAVTGGWPVVADAVGLAVGQAKATAALVEWEPLQEPTPDVRRVLRGLPFSNPLIQVWELKQLSRLFDAAVQLLEDTICDLLLELLQAHSPQKLVEALATQRLDPTNRADRARSARGAPGDPRRTPHQVF